MNDHPKVAVLLAAYNGSLYIEEQIKTIISQVNIDVDIYISVDLSTDDTYQIVNKLSEFNKRIKILPYGNRFGGAGSNFIHLIKNVDFTDYSYVAYSDQDDIWLDNKISHAISVMKKNNADGFSSNVTAFWPNGKSRILKKNYEQKKYDYIFEAAGPGCSIVMSRKLIVDIKRHILSNSKNIDEIWLHDWFSYSYARFHGYVWIIDSKPLMLYRQHEHNQVGANDGLRALIERVNIVLSGDAFNKVLRQSKFIGNECNVCGLLKENKSSNYLKLAFLANKCRRKRLDTVYFFIIMMFFSIKRLIKN